MREVDWRRATGWAIALLALSTTVSGQVILGSNTGAITDRTGAALPTSRPAPGRLV